MISRPVQVLSDGFSYLKGILRHVVIYYEYFVFIYLFLFIFRYIVFIWLIFIFAHIFILWCVFIFIFLSFLWLNYDLNMVWMLLWPTHAAVCSFWMIYHTDCVSSCLRRCGGAGWNWEEHFEDFQKHHPHPWGRHGDAGGEQASGGLTSCRAASPRPVSCL